jgi:hypothetical protein
MDSWWPFYKVHQVRLACLVTPCLEELELTTRGPFFSPKIPRLALLGLPPDWLPGRIGIDHQGAHSLVQKFLGLPFWACLVSACLAELANRVCFGHQGPVL